MIIVITAKERNKRTGVEEIIASHGVDERTGRTVILPQERPEQLGARFDDEIGEYVLPDEPAATGPDTTRR